MNSAMRGIVLGAAVAFLLIFAGMTLYALGSATPNFASVIAFGFSFLIIFLGLMGVIGAIRNPPDED
jgi:cytochrome c biogenesis protein CcdA